MNLKSLRLSLLLIALLAAPTASAGTVSAAPAAIKDVYVIHFILDGTNLETFNRALDAGKLPTIQQEIVEKGARFLHATSTFPSTSTTAYQAYVTGLTPGHSGIPHLERFDREHERVVGYLTTSGYHRVNTDLFNFRALLNPDEAELTPAITIFELLHGHPTAAVYSLFSRGATESYPGLAPVAALWDTYVSDRAENVDMRALRRVMELFDRPPEKIPRYTLVGLYSTDLMGHHFGPQSPEVEDVLVQFDRFLREFLEQLAEGGLADKTFIIISADHGMHVTGELFRFQEALEATGIDVKRNRLAKGFTLYTANRGVASSHLYVRHDGGFKPLTDPAILRRFPTGQHLRSPSPFPLPSRERVAETPQQAAGSHQIDLVEAILKMDATGLLIVRAGERRSRVFDRDGNVADVECTAIQLSEFCSYRPQQGDPLMLRSDPATARLADGRPHSVVAWRDASAAAAYPDAVAGLSEIFHDGRAGDLFIVTRGRYGFRKVKAGNHGGANAEDMRVPLLVAGPGIPHGSFGAARPFDLYPLVLSWFGIETPAANRDGVNPFSRSRSDDPLPAKLALLDQTFERQPPVEKMIDAGAFVQREVLPRVSRREFSALLPLARSESALRSRLVRKLERLQAALRAQKEDRDAPRIAEPAYLDDHAAIVQRTLRWARDGQQCMQDIELVLSGKYE